jgi:hypothetical protein
LSLAVEPVVAHQAVANAVAVVVEPVDYVVP